MPINTKIRLTTIAFALALAAAAQCRQETARNIFHI
jgi:hypothetical protein